MEDLVTFTELDARGAFVIDLDPRRDDRGFFARAFCQREFGNLGLATTVAQANIGHSRLRGTLRGLHYQTPPFAEAKLVRCTRGSVYDVMIDLRPGSPTFMRWVGFELSAAGHRMLYVPEGFAHGHQALEDESEVFYLVSQPFAPEHERGVRWNDPAFGIGWPIADPILSPKDRAFPDFER